MFLMSVLGISITDHMKVIANSSDSDFLRKKAPALNSGPENNTFNAEPLLPG